MSATLGAARGAMWSALEAWGIKGVSFGAFLVLAAKLEASDFGLMALAQSYLLVMQILSDQGFGVALVQRRKISDLDLDTAFWTNLAIGAVLAAVTFLAGPPIAAGLGQVRLGPILQWLAPAPILAALAIVQQATMQRAMAFRTLAQRRIAGALVGAGVGCAMALAGYGVWSLVGQYLGGLAAGLVILWGLGGWRPRARFSARAFQDLAGFGLNVAGDSLIRVAGQQSDRVLIGLILGPATLGLYQVAGRLTGFLTELLIAGTQNVVVPVFARVQDERERVRRGLYKANRLISFLALPAFFGFIATAPEAVSVLLDPKWASAVPIARILAWPSLFFAVGFFFGQVMTALGRPGLRLAATIFQSVLLILAVGLTVRHGVLWVAVGIAVVAALLYVAELLILARLTPFPVIDYLMGLVAPVFAAGAMAMSVAAARAFLLAGLRPGPALAAEVAIGILVYGGLSLVFQRQALKDARQLFQASRPGSQAKPAIPPPAEMH